MKVQLRLGAVAASVVAAVAGVMAPSAAGDAVYHTEHLALSPVGGAPLRSGFVQNIKAEGPQVYAHEVFVLNGAQRGATYTVTRNFHPFEPTCSGLAFRSALAQLETNSAGNARKDVFVRPADVPAFLVGVHGVRWTISDAAGSDVYETACTVVTLD